MPEKKGAASTERKKKPARKAATAKKLRKAAVPDDTSAAAPGVSRGSAKRAAGARLRVKQTRSGIGHAATYRRTLAALGLKYHQDEVVVPDHPSVRGMLRKVAHLVRVDAVEG